MLLIPTELRESKIQGVGVFYIGKEPIPAGKLVWEFQPRFDGAWYDYEVLDLPPEAQVHLYFNMWKSKHSHLYLLCGDNMKYVNHSKTPNTFFSSNWIVNSEPACLSYT